jgi:hypothetical protein
MQLFVAVPRARRRAQFPARNDRHPKVVTTLSQSKTGVKCWFSFRLETLNIRKDHASTSTGAEELAAQSHVGRSAFRGFPIGHAGAWLPNELLKWCEVWVIGCADL